MKFLPLRIAAITTAVLFTMSAASQPRAPGAPSLAPASQESIEDSVTTSDALLMFVSGTGILALQLRRKQKGLRTLRLRLPAN
jgi:hypothetical protein